MALQLFSVNADELVLNTANLNQVMENLKGAEVDALSVISISGAFRTGKSFMLDLMVKYLEYHETHHGESGELTPDVTWAKAADTRPRIHWKAGVDRDTLGILIYEKPFIRVVNESRVAILLIDTQGLWDGATNYSLLTAIFGLSSTISSVQIYNLMRNVELDKLDQIRWFSEFGSSAMKKWESAGSSFQTLHLLVRDWVGFNASNIKESLVESRKFLKQQCQQSEFGKFFQKLQEVYSVVEVALKPPPGQKCCFEAKFDGNLNDVDDWFLISVSNYFQRLFNKPVIKQINGNIVTPEAFRNLIVQFKDTFASGAPTTLSFTAAMEMSVTMCTSESALRIYRRSMANAIQNCKSVEEVDVEHQAAMEKSLAMFARKANYGSGTRISEERQNLSNKIQESKEEFTLKFKHRTLCGLNHMAPLTSIVIVSFLIDRLSDFTCDWWLSCCEQLSEVLLNVYIYGAVLIFCALAHHIVNNGGFITSQAMISLAQETHHTILHFVRSLASQKIHKKE